MRLLKDRGFVHPVPSEITPARLYHERRAWLQRLAAGGAGAALALWGGRAALAQAAPTARPNKLAPLPGAKSGVAGALTMEKLTSYEHVTGYNNFYEFGTEKSEPAANAGRLKTRPWTVAIEGAVNKPGTWDLDALLKLAPMEERIYRLALR